MFRFPISKELSGTGSADAHAEDESTSSTPPPASFDGTTDENRSFPQDMTPGGAEADGTHDAKGRVNDALRRAATHSHVLTCNDRVGGFGVI